MYMALITLGRLKYLCTAQPGAFEVKSLLKFEKIFEVKSLLKFEKI